MCLALHPVGRLRGGRLEATSHAMIRSSQGQVPPIILASALAGVLEVLLRSLAPLPYALQATGLALSGLFYSAAIVPALLASRLAPRRRGTIRLLAGAPFGLLALNLALAFGEPSRPLVVGLAIDAAVCVGAAIITFANRSLLAGAIVSCLVAATGLRWSAPSTAVAAVPGPSVLMVVLDTTTASHLSAYGYDRETSPSLAALARRGLIYRRAISPAAWTIPAHASIFSGRYPSQLGFQGFGFSAPDAGSIATDLVRSGRPAFGISANPLVPRQPLLRAGFEKLWSARRLTRPAPRRFAEALFLHFLHEPSFARGEQVTDLALDWVDRLAPRGRPWFLFLNYMEAHAPYDPPRPEREHFAAGVDPDDVAPQLDYDSGRRPLTPRAVTAMRALYDAEIATLDRAVERLLGGLAKRGYDERNLLLVVTADHGEALGEHGLVGHLRGLPEGVLHVPLLVSGPGVQAGEVTEPVQTVQLRATLRRLLGLEDLPGVAPALPPWGVTPPLVITEHPEVPFTRETLRALATREGDPWRGDWVAVERAGTKVIFDGRGHGQTFRLADDPGEMHPRPLDDALDLVRDYEAWRRTTSRDGTAR